ncbi:MAG: tRNA 2-selenouridine(34) synthase MnmH [Betaproteobacteria bacterium]|jgi:tRNA 2-selenouridine synthase
MAADAAAPRRDAVEPAAALAHSAEYSAILDARSPAEFAEDALPGAINCPVLDDAQRAQVGTLYKQDSPFAARRVGAALAARNIAALLELQFAAQPRDWRPLVYCWRGGERSGALVHVLRRIGWRAQQLAGGYRAWRRMVLAQLEVLPARYRWQVVCGPTGSGKSRLLRALAEAGAQVLDLEELACHRGSVLGGLPGAAQPSQKRFEGLIWWALHRFDPARPVYVESESRKVGNLRVPTALLDAMRAAPCLRLELPLPQRIRLLREEYTHFEQAPAALTAQLDCLVPLHGHGPVAQWKQLAAAGDWQALVEQLLTQHYDPAYRRSLKRNFPQAASGTVLVMDGSDAAQYATAARALAG